MRARTHTHREGAADHQVAQGCWPSALSQEVHPGALGLVTLWKLWGQGLRRCGKEHCAGRERPLCGGKGHTAEQARSDRISVLKGTPGVGADCVFARLFTPFTQSFAQARDHSAVCA